MYIITKIACSHEAKAKTMPRQEALSYLREHTEMELPESTYTFTRDYWAQALGLSRTANQDQANGYTYKITREPYYHRGL